MRRLFGRVRDELTCTRSGVSPSGSTVIGADIPRKRNALEKRGVTKGVKKSRVGARYEPLSPVKLGGRNSPALKGSLLTFESSPSAELKPSREDDIPFSVTSRPLSAPLHGDVLSPSNLQPPDSSSAICSISPHDARQDIQTGVSLQSTPGSNFVPKRRRARNPSRDSATRKSRLSPLASAAPTTPPTAPRIMDTGMDRFDVGGGEVQAELTSPNLAEELELQKLFHDQRRSTRTKRSVTYEGWDDELEAPSPKRTKLTVPSSIKVTDRPRSKKAKSAVFHCSFPLCTATFTRQNDLVRHLRNSSAHSSTSDAQDDEDKRCAHCNRKLSRADARRRHEISGACGKRNTKNKPGHPAESYISFS
ncbi:hypothetical protein FPV67DRAFT_442912 [Lyophyllum atratum]|nr:hypothetical protein FPV67DRAFT_442912 [Lyophyllum atratum]